MDKEISKIEKAKETVKDPKIKAEIAKKLADITNNKEVKK